MNSTTQEHTEYLARRRAMRAMVSAYNPTSFREMGRTGIRDFADSCESVTTPAERNHMIDAIADAIQWGIQRDDDYAARLRYEQLIRQEQALYEKQRLEDAAQRRVPDIVIHI